MPRSPQAMRDSIARNMQQKTGRSLDEWIALVREQGLSAHGPIVKWLMSEHGLTRGYAGAVAWSLLSEEVAPETLVDRQYEGKETLRTIYERILEEVHTLGGVTEPRRTYVSFTNGRQFALVQASAKTRVDLGLVLPGTRATTRLQDAGSFGSGNVTHRVALSSADDVDDRVRAWLRAAFERAGR